ncbi:hypothetical protein FRC04_010899, partial [Tulasnella sp. 424]
MADSDQTMSVATPVHALWGKIANAATPSTLSFAAAGRALSPGLDAQISYQATQLSGPPITAVHLAVSLDELLALVPLPYRSATAPLLNGARRMVKDFADVRASHNRLSQCSHKGQVPTELAGVHAPNYQYLSLFEEGKTVAKALKERHEAFVKSSLDALIAAKALEQQSCVQALKPESYAGLVQAALQPVYDGLKKHRHVLTFGRKDEGGELEPLYEDEETDAKHEFELALVTVGRAMSRMIQLELVKADDLWSKAETKRELAAQASLAAGDPAT